MGRALTTADIEPASRRHPERHGRPHGASYGLSGALVLVAAATAAITFSAPDVLRGVAVMNGSARGTALVVLAVAVPVLALSMLWATRGSTRALVLWLGGLAYLLYNSVLFLFLTPLNQLFLGYVAMLSLSIWSAVAVIGQLDRAGLRQWFAPQLPVRGIAVYLWVVATMNALAWLARVIPAAASSQPPGFLDGTDMPTNPVYVQDLAFWIPLTVLGAAWFWRRRSWGYLLAGIVLTLSVIESAGIATDQWFGHAADPVSPVASAALVPVFATLALVGLVPLSIYLRHLRRPER